MADTTEPSVIVVGAGVLGLSCATLLQKKYPSTPITVIAAELPGTTNPTADYASMWAGAHYRPIPRSTRQLNEEAELGFRTAEIMRTIAKDTPDAGVAIMKGVEYLESPPEENLVLKTGDAYAGPDDSFRVFEKQELPNGVKWGCEYQAYCVNVPVYCNWLLDRFVANGGKIIKHRLSSARDGFSYAKQQNLGRVRTIVNCSGRNFDQDPKMKFIRGQTVLVKQNYHTTVTRQMSDGSWAFLIPRPCGGGTIVGGTKEVGDPETQPRPESRQKLLEQSVEYYPDFVDAVDKFDVVQDNVGRRPWREGGLRVEAEVLSPQQRIIHCYGAGGRGYELSWGVAEAVLRLFEKSQTDRPRL